MGLADDYEWESGEGGPGFGGGEERGFEGMGRRGCAVVCHVDLQRARKPALLSAGEECVNARGAETLSRAEDGVSRSCDACWRGGFRCDQRRAGGRPEPAVLEPEAGG